ncbi:MAG: hypothetical protein FWG14_01165 [Peptococcaceae bacterium]|nr:hypothetical protein [Peptococcaceae bacterium]
MDLLLIEQLIRMVNMSSLSCLEIEEQGVRIRLENQTLGRGVSSEPAALNGGSTAGPPGSAGQSGITGQPGATGPGAVAHPNVVGHPNVMGPDSGPSLGSAQNGSGSLVSPLLQIPQGFPKPGAPPATPEQEENVVYIKSPLVGTYYSTQALGYDPVEPGDRVTVGQAVCAVEAMKLMNVIEAEVAGEIIEFMAEDGALIEYGQHLVKIRKS